MKEAIIDIKMNPHRPKKPASDEYTTDEEEMIVYDVEDEIESNPDYVKENEVNGREGDELLLEDSSLRDGSYMSPEPDETTSSDSSKVVQCLDEFIFFSNLLLSE
ncbi:hypothetical protein TNCV_54901 [Trichonephila clavipes]|nr:hypothetical protein TNCV_54901 [Trichonephila clavipes]